MSTRSSDRNRALAKVALAQKGIDEHGAATGGFCLGRGDDFGHIAGLVEPQALASIAGRDNIVVGRSCRTKVSNSAKLKAAEPSP